MFDTVSVCQDCLIAYHNGEPHPGAMRDDIEALGVPEDDGFFSSWHCDTCDQKLAGQRYDVTVLWR